MFVYVCVSVYEYVSVYGGWPFQDKPYSRHLDENPVMISFFNVFMYIIFWVFLQQQHLVRTSCKVKRNQTKQKKNTSKIDTRSRGN